jgi:hypothetical protein
VGAEGEGEGAEGEGECLPLPHDLEHFGLAGILQTLRVEPGQGFDLDGDRVVDNALAASEIFRLSFNETMASSLAQGSMRLALELARPDLDQLPQPGEECLAVNLWRVSDSDVPADPTDDFDGDERFVVDPHGLGDDGFPLAQLTAATLGEDDIVAGPSDIRLLLPVGEAVLELPIRRARLRALLEPRPDEVAGLLGGALDEGELLAALAAAGIVIPAMVTPEMLFGEPDLDLDDDGVAESFSLGLVFTYARAELTARGAELCRPGQVQPCRCADGTAGEAICQDDGRWGECRCQAACPAPPDLLSFGQAAVVQELLAEADVGFDLDDDGRLDNALARQPLFAASFNATVAESIRSGAFRMAVEVIDPAVSPDRLPCPAVHLWKVRDRDVPADPADDFSGGESFLVDLASLGDDGFPRAFFPDFRIAADGSLSAGPRDIVLALPVGMRILPVPLRAAQLLGVRRVDGGWAKGILGGIIPHAELVRALEDAGVVFPEGFSLADLLGEPDIDLDDDRVDDGYSIGLRFTAAAATLTAAVPVPDRDAP